MRLLFWIILIFACSPLQSAPELFIDPGHGGIDLGVRDGDLNEAGIVFDIATQAAALLKLKGVECALARSASGGSLPSARVAAANASGAKAFLSLHVNHSPSVTVRGPRIFIPKAAPAVAKDEPQRWNNSAGQKSDEAKLLGLELAKALSQSESAKVNVQNLNLVSFKGLAIPGVVVELGFLSHAESKARFASAEYRAAVAGRVAEAVFAWARPGSGTAKADGGVP